MYMINEPPHGLVSHFPSVRLDYESFRINEVCDLGSLSLSKALLSSQSCQLKSFLCWSSPPTLAASLFFLISSQIVDA